jgi:hypothetical protein
MRGVEQKQDYYLEWPYEVIITSVMQGMCGVSLSERASYPDALMEGPVGMRLELCDVGAAIKMR